MIEKTPEVTPIFKNVEYCKLCGMEADHVCVDLREPIPIDRLEIIDTEASSYAGASDALAKLQTEHEALRKAARALMERICQAGRWHDFDAEMHTLETALRKP